MTQQPNPKQPQPGRQEGAPGQQPDPRKPRYDDRPEQARPGQGTPSKEKSDREAIQREENEGSAGSTTKKPEQQTGKGMPQYGDREPGDPRRTDVEGDDVETGS